MSATQDRERRIDRMVQISAGLLASGQFTAMDEDELPEVILESWVNEEDKRTWYFPVVEEAERVLTAIEKNVDKNIKLASEGAPT